MKEFFISFGAAFVVTIFLTPLVRRLAIRINAVDVPEEKKVHESPTPTLGGIAIFSGVIAGFLVYFAISDYKISADIIGIMIGALVILICGIIDDIRPLSPPAKVFGQVLAAGIPIIMGVQIQSMYIPGFSIVSFSTELSVVISLIWIIAFMNAINLIDGLDGLAAGITCIAAASIFYYSTRVGVIGVYVEAALISIVLAGATLAFLRYNFNPASIFMGDSGSMLLGFLLGTSTIQGMLKSVAATALFIPLIALGIPLLDTGMAVIRRAFKGAAITNRDKEHLHYRLMAIGHSHRKAVLILYFWTALLCVASLMVRFMASSVKLWLVLLLAFGIGFALTSYPRLHAAPAKKGKHRVRRKKNGNGE